MGADHRSKLAAAANLRSDRFKFQCQGFEDDNDNVGFVRNLPESK